jgi:hypothetical protein
MDPVDRDGVEQHVVFHGTRVFWREAHMGRASRFGKAAGMTVNVSHSADALHS